MDQEAEATRPEKKQRKLPASLSSYVSTTGALTSQGHPQLAPLLAPARPLGFKGSIQLAKTEAEAVWLMGKILLDKPFAVGFDVEWRVSYETGFPPRKIALIQICYRFAGGDVQHPAISTNGSDCLCLIFQLFHCGVPTVLSKWLSNSSVIKAGANIGGDACKLKGDYGVDLGNAVDLGGLLARQQGGRMLSSLQRKGLGLSDMLNEATGGKLMLSKPGNIRTGDWEVKDLTESQVRYAATDAFASLLVYELLTKPL
jgi:hypothetical protein